jgi:hypothetical protein
MLARQAIDKKEWKKSESTPKRVRLINGRVSKRWQDVRRAPWFFSLLMKLHNYPEANEKEDRR